MTCLVLIVASILVSSYKYIDSSDSSIQCFIDKGTTIPANVINQYCWIMSTFTLPKHFKCIPGEDCLHMGVGKYFNRILDIRWISDGK